MNVQDYNNFFGDMDLFLMDLILKGHVSKDAKILDVGCGEGRNGAHFIQQGFEYHGWDTDASKLSLLAYFSKGLKKSKAQFKPIDLRSADEVEIYDFIICSRVLHFAESTEDFKMMWGKLAGLLRKNGTLYVSMDSIIDNDLGIKLEGGKVEFSGSKIRFALTTELYQEIKKGFEEIAPLVTLVHHNMRAQSFICLRKA